MVTDLLLLDVVSSFHLTPSRGFVKEIDLTWKERLFLAIQLREIKDLRSWTNQELGDAVAKALDRPTPYTREAVRSWLAGTVPERYVVRAIGTVLGVDDEWLYSGQLGPHTKSTSERVEEIIARLSRNDPAKHKRRA